ncbi:hypothetical protein ACHAQA_009925 [Verticillium albo-atrum]
MQFSTLLVAILPVTVFALPYLPFEAPTLAPGTEAPDVPVIERGAFDAAALETLEASQ